MPDLSFISRGFVAGPLRFRFRCDSEETVAIYEQIFRDLGSCENPSEEIEVSHAYRHGFVRRPGGSIHGVPREDLVPWETLRQVNLAALDADVERIHVHGAAVEIEGRGTLVVAPAGTGKTTTTALLTARGGVYATDEMVGFSKGDEYLGTAFPKPFSIKEDHSSAITEYAELGLRAPVGENELSIVPASLVGDVMDVPLEIGLIVFLTRDSDNRLGATEVHAANATAELAIQAMDLKRGGSAGLSALATVAARSARVVVSAGTPAETADLILNLALSLGPPEPVDPPPALRDAGSGIEWVDFGDAVTFHSHTSDMVGSLHGHEANTWRVNPDKSEMLLTELLN